MAKLTVTYQITLNDDEFARAPMLAPLRADMDHAEKEFAGIVGEGNVAMSYELVTSSAMPVPPAVRRGRPRKDTAPKPITELSVEEMRSLVGHAA